jgi:hypothetical protein
MLTSARLSPEVLTWKSFEALQEISKGAANKVFIPTSALETLGSIGAIGEMLAAKK